MSAEETSRDETELNEISRGKRWGNNNNRNQNVLVLATIAATTTNPNKTDLRTTEKASSGTKSKGLQDHLDTGSQTTTYPLNSVVTSLDNST